MVPVQALDIARWRLRSQRLVWPYYAVSAREAVGSLLAAQAENPSPPRSRAEVWPG